MDTELNCHCVYVDFLGLQFHSMIRRCVFGKKQQLKCADKKVIEGMAAHNKGDSL